MYKATTIEIAAFCLASEQPGITRFRLTRQLREEFPEADLRTALCAADKARAKV